RIPAYPQQSETVIVNIDITDDTGIMADTLFYAVNYGADSPLPSDSISGNTYYYTIPGYNSNDIVDYYIKAVDDSSASAYSDTFDYTVGTTSAPGMKVLFDFTKEETAGEADWIIDTDYPHPSPESPSSESDWLGGISYWGFELDSFGYECWTLPPGNTITYDTLSTDSLDLSYFDVFIIPEPQNPFTASEKQAIFDFVRNGGGLFMVADHVSSDRNNNGWDSPMIYDDLPSDSFGIHFQQVGEGDNNLSSTSSSFTDIPADTDSIVTGPWGDCNNDPADAALYYHAGTTNPANSDPDVYEIAPVDGDATRSMLTAARRGKGKVIGMGDSSPADDGTGQSGNTLYDGWTEGAARYLILNATYWLSVGSTGNTGINQTFSSFEVDNNTVRINISITSPQRYSIIRLYRKTKSQRRYEFAGSLKADNSVEFTDNIEGIEGRINYKVIALDNNGNEEMIDFISVNNPQSDLRPVNSLVSYSIELAGSGESRYSIYNASGRMLTSGSITQKLIDISHLGTGLYFLEINNRRYKIIKIK
ncbi:MAG: T9SS type A sorting domain-containing protein, partial [candidate division WOR-3 bacterium]|nr:T9SS type A sorting domain-containing protein [candidate division WOR-3 bacterium]